MLVLIRILQSGYEELVQKLFHVSAPFGSRVILFAASIEITQLLYESK